MIISVYLYKDCVEIYTYTNGNGGMPDVKQMPFSEKLQPEVEKILNSFRDKNDSLNIRTYTSDAYVKEYKSC